MEIISAGSLIFVGCAGALTSQEVVSAGRIRNAKLLNGFIVRECNTWLFSVGRISGERYPIRGVREMSVYFMFREFSIMDSGFDYGFGVDGMLLV